jgi:hypothetical protein
MLSAYQDRAVKTMALKCVSACITTYLQRTAPETRGRDLPPILRQPLGAVLGLLRKNAFQAAEQRARDCSTSVLANLVHVWQSPAATETCVSAIQHRLSSWILQRLRVTEGYAKVHLA